MTQGGTSTRLSVVIPMRNEVDRIPLLLSSLERQHRRPDQVVVVDDGSNDGSAEAARAFAEVEVVTASSVPVGWTGKSWACTTGARASDGEILVFLDADVVLGVDAMGQLLSTWSTCGDLVSVQPHHHFTAMVERSHRPRSVQVHQQQSHPDGSSAVLDTIVPQEGLTP